MSKIWKLFVNENIKTWKKFSTKLAIVLVILSLVGTLGFVLVMKYMNERTQVIYSTYNWKESAQNEITSIEKTIETEELDEQSKTNMRVQLEKLQMALKYEVNPYGNYWKTEVLNEISETKLLNEQTRIDELTQLLEKDDFKGYIEIQKQEERQELDYGLISQQEYNDQIKILDIKQSCEIGKNEEEEYWKRTILNETQMLQNSVRTGIDYQNRKVLTVEKKQQYEEDIKINIYRLENNMPPIEYVNENYRMIFETLASMFIPAVIAIVAIIIAGGAISSEVSSGTIKFWALTPNRRWKILTAKILSMLFYIIIITLIASILTVVLGSISFETSGNEYLYVKNGNVEKIGNTLFVMGYYLAKTIPIIIFALFALMLSTVTRNTSVSVSISVAIYMGNSIAMAIINSYIKKDWIKFIPFNNLNLADKIFANFDNPMGIVTSGTISTSLVFSLGVLAVCAILMLVTMYDSFNKRDII